LNGQLDIAGRVIKVAFLAVMWFMEQIYMVDNSPSN
jgi:hypothetical protein